VRDLAGEVRLDVQPCHHTLASSRRAALAALALAVGGRAQAVVGAEAAREVIRIRQGDLDEPVRVHRMALHVQVQARVGQRAMIFARTACYNRDVAAFYAKWLDDVADAQHPSGAYPDIAPRLSIPWAGAPAWADAGVIVPWTVWKMYGDRCVLRRHFGGMSRWMDFVARGNPDYLRSTELGNSYNDWLAPVDDHTPPALLATAYWAHDASLMAEISTVLDGEDEAAEYRALREKIGAAFADAFVSADGSVASGTQTAYTLALHMDLVPSSLRSSTASHLVSSIEAADWHLTTGFVGVGYLLPVLSSCGRDDVAYRLLAQRSLPSGRYMLDNGATTIWERWDGWSASRGFQSAWMNSFNHYSLGSVAE